MGKQEFLHWENVPFKSVERERRSQNKLVGLDENVLLVQLSPSAPLKPCFCYSCIRFSVSPRQDGPSDKPAHQRVTCVFADVQRQRGLKSCVRSQATWSWRSRSGNTQSVFTVAAPGPSMDLTVSVSANRGAEMKIQSAAWRRDAITGSPFTLYYRGKLHWWGEDHLGDFPMEFLHRRCEPMARVVCARAPSSQDVCRLHRAAQSKQSAWWWSRLGLWDVSMSFKSSGDERNRPTLNLSESLQVMKVQ